MTSSTALSALLAFGILVLAGAASERWFNRASRREAEQTLAAIREAMHRGPTAGEGLALDARPRRGLLVAGLVMVIVFYGFGFGGALLLALRVEWYAATSPAAALALSLWAAFVWLLGFAMIGLYAVAGAHRFALHDRGFSVFTWRGWRHFEWAGVRHASLQTWKGAGSLVLTFHGLCRIELPIDDYEEADALLGEIERRLPVAVLGAARRRR